MTVELRIAQRILAIAAFEPNVGLELANPKTNASRVRAVINGNIAG